LERLAQQYVGRLPVYRVDIERDMAVAERFGVQSIPTVLIVREGKEVERLDGLITDDDLKEAFERAIREAPENGLRTGSTAGPTG
jgi:thioredoxin 2